MVIFTKDCILNLGRMYMAKLFARMNIHLDEHFIYNLIFSFTCPAVYVSCCLDDVYESKQRSEPGNKMEM